MMLNQLKWKVVYKINFILAMKGPFLSTAVYPCPDGPYAKLFFQITHTTRVGKQLQTAICKKNHKVVVVTAPLPGH